MRGFDVHDAPSANEFLPKLLDSQAFEVFVQTNGSPYRKLHMFDEVHLRTRLLFLCVVRIKIVKVFSDFSISHEISRFCKRCF